MQTRAACPEVCAERPPGLESNRRIAWAVAEQPFLELADDNTFLNKAWGHPACKASFQLADSSFQTLAPDLEAR